MRLVPWGLAWILGVAALQSKDSPKLHPTSEHRCVSKHDGVTDTYCAKVKCDNRFAEFCVWLDSPDGYHIIETRQANAANGAGAQDVINSLVGQFGRSHGDRPAPRETAPVTTVPQQDSLPQVLASCWVPTAWYPKHECGQPDPAECSRGWSVYVSQEGCCQSGAAFTKGCDGNKEGNE